MGSSGRIYRVSDIHCDHCEETIEQNVTALVGVQNVQVDRAAGLVTVHGADVSDEQVRAAIQKAGYTAES